MITVTSTELHEQVQSPDKEIILNGPPSHLTGHFTIENKSQEVMFIKELPINMKAKKMSAALSNLQQFQINTALQPGEVRNHFAWLSVHPQTPPGIHETYVMMGGKECKVKMLIQENVELELVPRNIVFRGVVAGKKYTGELTLMNKGNVPVNIPDLKHSTMLDMDFICRSLSKAIREKGSEGYIATMDALTKDINKDMAGWVSISIDEAGQQLKEGQSMQIHISITLPKTGIDPKRNYFGDVRLIDNIIFSYRILPD
jgi:hypothetical protein